MDQSRAINALAPFVALAKSANSPRAAADLITQATSAPNTYVFAELLQQPNIQSLSGNAQYGAHLTLLQCFAWGTWETYKITSNLPSLSDAQSLKLRLLSLLSIASEQPARLAQASHLSYPSLCERLDLSTSLELEHLVTTATYRGLLTATLDPAAGTVRVAAVAPLRDLAPQRVAGLIADLDAWRRRCDGAAAALDAEIRRVHLAAEKRVRRETGAERQIRAANESGGAGGGGGESKIAVTGGNPNVNSGGPGGNGGFRSGPGGTTRSSTAGGGLMMQQQTVGKKESVGEEDDRDDPMDVDASGPGMVGAGRKRVASGGLMSKFGRGGGR